MEWHGSSNNTSTWMYVEPGVDINSHNSKFSAIFSTKAASTIVYVFNDILGIPLTVLGIVANIFNIIVFTKQGFKQTIDISMTSLAVADLAFLVHSLWQIMSLMSSLGKLTWPFHFAQFGLVLGSIPKTYYRRVSGILTAYIAVERCVSVVRPLQVKFIFTRKRLTISIFMIYLVNALPFIGSMLTYRIGWKFDPSQNYTYLGVIVSQENSSLNSFGIGIGLFLSFSTFLVVTICTFILVWSLYKQGQWRRKILQHTKGIEKRGGAANVSRPEATRAECQKTSTLSGRDKRASKTVTLIAAMYVLCYLPGLLSEIAMLIVAEFSRGGRYRNAYFVFGVLAVRAEAICASANIIVYYRTGTKFRETVSTMFCASRVYKLNSSRSGHSK